ncbi:uncharacterized protein LOC101736481 isoform X1 [Bombyx mori]|uniref:LIM zinc-binding domain-containing protein n=1 Tax=Bombyx mori TaxID=7091 RepID=A0A8R2HRK1_BOMMO|nr:uncharacterized protein LOC101736481 isoform X1 [Bombyx mori]
MACEVCDHCHESLHRNEDIVVWEGYSFHNRCHKCFVCSETDLLNAEIFKGAIFCGKCSKRIFNDCASAKQIRKPKIRTKYRRTRRTKRSTDKKESNYSGPGYNEIDSKTQAIRDPIVVTYKKGEKNNRPIRKVCIDTGITTVVTQELLDHFNNVQSSKERNDMSCQKIYSNDSNDSNRTVCSDMRIAELGASTEIANMALKKSELPAAKKSDVARLESSVNYCQRSSSSKLDSVDSDDLCDDCRFRRIYLEDSNSRYWTQRRISSIVKIPFKSFKQNILDRSSLVNVALDMESSESNFIEKMKILFYEDISEHYRSGVEKLYSIIGRNQKPRKLGWLNTRVMSKEAGCRHICNSHSYRFMRSQVMRMAGPTDSRLATFRATVKKIVVPSIVRNIITLDRKEPAAILPTRDWGNDTEKI